MRCICWLLFYLLCHTLLALTCTRSVAVCSRGSSSFRNTCFIKGFNEYTKAGANSVPEFCRVGRHCTPCYNAWSRQNSITSKYNPKSSPWRMAQARTNQRRIAREQSPAASSGTGTLGGTMRRGIDKLQRKVHRKEMRKKIAAAAAAEAAELDDESEADDSESEGEDEAPQWNNEVSGTEFTTDATTTEASPIDATTTDVATDEAFTTDGSMMDIGANDNSPPASSTASRSTTPGGPTRQAFDQARMSLRESVGKKPRSSAPPALHHAIQPVLSAAEKRMQREMQALEGRIAVRQPALLSSHFVFMAHVT